MSLSYSKESRVRHGRYTTIAAHHCRCMTCGWDWQGSQSGANKVTRAHLLANDGHVVITQRVQGKTSRVEEVQVLR